MKLPRKKLLVISLLIVLFFVLGSRFLVQPAHAGWVEPDPEVTEVGRSSDRARQLLFWLFVTPSLDNSPAIRSMWAVSRNIVLGLFVLMVIFIGIALILSRTKGGIGEVFSGIASPLYGARLPAILLKIAVFLGFVVFSYIIILGLVQVSDILMRFFVERVGGANLFNITLNPENIKNIEDSYTKYIGARETSLENIESVRTNLFMVRLTAFTYNIMFIALVLRKIILWFLLIVSPFLALLMPFVFIRNIGWIWIGVFFQWLFYGPLFSIFLAGLVKIWEFGIPYAFNFSRVDKPEGQIFKTATDLLYGGPAQTLTAMNSCNYVDTYAEYVIALIMLWTVILLPWLLLRIFRDYCCEAFHSQESAVMALYNKLSGGLPPPPSPPPAKPGPTARFELPFRAKAPMARELPEAITAAQVAQISRAETKEIMRAMNLEVASIRDVATFEMNLQKQHTARETLSRLSRPAEVPSVMERRNFSTLRQELTSRAIKGDIEAQRTLTAAEGRPQIIAAHIQTPHIKVAAAPKERKPGLPIAPTIKPVPPTPVTLEEYEEVKKMWIKHYRESEVPVSEKVKDRETWLETDLAQITNTIELLVSQKTEEKQRGYDEVAAILPFLLLGGFSEKQTVTYLKAKLEAAKTVLEELERAEKIKEEAKREAEEELVEVPAPTVEEKEKEAELKAKLEMEPEETRDTEQETRDMKKEVDNKTNS